ncbi:MAG TPA: site-specific integrase, partial [Lacipirellulaceae bacterium]|nr:site-specific integrase [Lacipirellulaceae bacterium]
MFYITMPTVRKLKKTTSPALLPAVTALSPSELGDAARKAAEEILVAGQAENTLISYRSAMRYWCAWAQLRYGTPLALPVQVPVVVQFLVDHIARGSLDAPVSELPKAIDKLMVESGLKGRPGPLKMSTVVHRMAVLSKLHQLRRKTNPCEDPQVRHLLSTAKRAASKRGEAEAKKTAATKEPLEAMLATCDDSLEGARDRAILLFGWASGGRRRSEIAAAMVEQLTKVGDQGYLFRLTRSKTNQEGADQPAKPIRGKAADALRIWLDRSEINSGMIFRRLWKGRLGPALSPAAIAAVVKKRARLAGIEGDWGGHSLRSGFVTEAGKRNIPIGDVMAMTDHRKVDTV